MSREEPGGGGILGVARRGFRAVGCCGDACPKDKQRYEKSPPHAGCDYGNRGDITIVVML